MTASSSKQVEAIVAGLNDRQRAIVLAHEGGQRRPYTKGEQFPRISLFTGHKLLAYAGRTGVWSTDAHSCLTPLGLAVRAALQSKDQ